MPTTLVIRLPWGRFHATPWARHVNEGEVELPPSPWRLLRALYAVWKSRRPDLNEATVHALLARLAEPPTYLLPPFRIAHTRHYYPDSTHRPGAISTDRTLDAFAVFERGAELAVRWPFTLEAEEDKTFGQLASSLPYFGRAESICEARVEHGWDGATSHRPFAPLDIGESIPADVDVVTRLAPALPLDVEALTLRPVDVRAERLLFPRGSRFVAYARPPEQPVVVATRRRRGTSAPVTAARFTVTQNVLPPETDALAVTDLLRLAAVQKLNRVRGHVHRHSHLVGRGDDDRVLEGHRHAHYLALAEDHRIAEVAVWAPGEFEDDELEALSRICRLRSPDGMPGPRTVELRLSGYGSTDDLLPELSGVSATWVSRTPFVPPRHPKRDWASFLEREVMRELTARALPPATSVVPADGDARAFLRYRPSKRFGRPTGPERRVGRGERRTGPPGEFVEVRFAEPVGGPLALGHLSHFGLGLFAPRSRDRG